LVTAFETYYFWVNFSDALREIKRVLKKGGKLLLVNEMIQNGVFEIENAKLIEKAHVRLIPLQKMQTIMLSMGFTYVKVFTKNKSSWNAIIAQK
jgi:ubiquinone/menaquinone biosynthesis C-methylase UbiE